MNVNAQSASLRWVLVLAALLSTAGYRDDNSLKFAMLGAEAKAKAVSQIRKAADAAFPPGFALEELPPQPLNCTDISGKPAGRVMIGISYWVSGISTTQNGHYGDALKVWWAGHGWTLIADSRPGDLFVNATRDEYLMSLRANVDQRLVIGNSTPCV